MFKKILTTGLTRILGAAVSFIIVLLNARNLGASGMGTIALILLDITIISYLSGFAGGASLTYYTPINKLSQLLRIAWISALIAPLLFFLFSLAINPFPHIYNTLIPKGYLPFILLIGTVMGLYSNNLAILLGKEKIYTHNLLNITQFILLLLALFFFYYVMKDLSIKAYLQAYLLSIVMPFGLSHISLAKIKREDDRGEKKHEKVQPGKVLSYGAWVQSASLMQLFNYRLPYYFLKSYFPAGQRLGIYTTANQLAEGLWIIGKSVSLVQYARIANRDNKTENAVLTIRLAKFSLALTSLGLLTLLSLPTSFYRWLFGPEFSEVKTVIAYLSPGIIFLVLNMMFAHYLSGMGKPKFNALTSLVGIIFIAVFSFYLIPNLGISGAAIAASLTYMLSAFISGFFFFRHAKIPLSTLIIRQNDIHFFIELIRQAVNKNYN